LGALALIVVVIIIATVVSLRKSRLGNLGKANPIDGTVVTAAGDVVKLWGGNGDKITVQLGLSLDHNSR
jgi:hypothetical protein